MARWPNAYRSDDSLWDQDHTWAHGTHTNDGNEYENGVLIDSPQNGHSLEDDYGNVTGAIAILNIGSFRTWSRRVTSHNGDTITFDPVPSSEWKTKHHKYFLEGKLEFLDSAGEWLYDKTTQVIYFWPPNNMDPSTLDIRGKTRSYIFLAEHSDYVKVMGLEFFAATFYIEDCYGCIVTECKFEFPSTSKRMLGSVDTAPEMSKVQSSENCTVSKSSFRFTDGCALEMHSNKMNVIDNYFYEIDWSVADGNSIQTTFILYGDYNLVSRNTMHKLGASATIRPGDAAIVEYNNIWNTGLMQSDGAISQMMVEEQTGAQVRYNWFHDSPKYGARFDGNGAGHNGTMHHNVIWNCGKGFMLKGYNHFLLSNTAFNNQNGVDGNDMAVMIAQGGNDGTITRNNAANRIAGHRTGNYDSYPVPGIYDHNFNGYENDLDVTDYLQDPYGDPPDFSILNSS